MRQYVRVRASAEAWDDRLCSRSLS